MLADLRWGASSHKDVLDNNYAFMKSCQAQQAALVDDLQQDQESRASSATWRSSEQRHQ